MSFVPVIGFAVLALAAVGFAAVPLWHVGGPRKARALLAGAIALFLLGVGGGTYWMVGQPYLAVRAGEGLQTRDMAGLVPYLIRRVRQVPGDLQAWRYLAGTYMSLGDAGDAARAYQQALAVAEITKRPPTGLYAAYGEALMAQAGGTVTLEAEAAFTTALAQDPKDEAARFFLGQARAARGDKEGAAALWQGLLAETPDKAPLHQILVDRLALLMAGSGAAPDPRAMVAGLAARLKAQPDDPAGWQRLIRAYSVLNQPDQARAALGQARKIFAGSKDARAALDAEARELKLE